MRSVLDGLAGLVRRFRFGVLQVRTVTAALALSNYRYFVRFITGSTSGFNDPTRLARWTSGFLYAGVAMLLARWFAQALMMIAGIQQSEVAGVVWLVLRGIQFYGVVLLLPAWTLRANYNARQLGASTMKFTPEWAAGWYFMPPGMFWKPYQVMQEIWKASVQPHEWRSQHGSPLVGWWWGLWLVSSWAGALASGVAALTLEAGAAEAAESAIMLVRRFANVGSALILLTFIARVHRMQMARYRESESGCAY